MNNIVNLSEYDKKINCIARKLCNGDKYFAQELINEMYVSVLASKVSDNMSLCLREAKFRAIDYLRSIRKKNTTQISLEAMEEAGFQIDIEGKIYSPEDESTVFMEGFCGIVLSCQKEPSKL